MLLLSAGVDVIVIDTSHGHSVGVLDAIKDTKINFPACELVAGNVATSEGAEALISAGWMQSRWELVPDRYAPHG